MSAADELRLYRTGFHPCGYWPDRYARDLLIDPRDPRINEIYPLALGWGFRRSGEILYRPDCVACKACVAVRIPVQQFKPDRSQRRCLVTNADLTTRVVPAERTKEQFALYRRYLANRHPAGGMDAHSEADFDGFLVGRWSRGKFLEIRKQGTSSPGTLLAVAVTDVVDNALSAVYTFYDPLEAKRGLGTFGVLQQIEWARREGREFLYLGYWIDGHPKMDYKRRFHPMERYDGRAWVPLEPLPRG